jgi:hypothetical protein
MITHNNFNETRGLVTRSKTLYRQRKSGLILRRLEKLSMKSKPTDLTYEIELRPGEKLVLPESLVDSVGPGRWVVNVTPLGPARSSGSIRDHRAFLNGFAVEDEELYDDYSAR